MFGKEYKLLVSGRSGYLQSISIDAARNRLGAGKNTGETHYICYLNNYKTQNKQIRDVMVFTKIGKPKHI